LRDDDDASKELRAESSFSLSTMASPPDPFLGSNGRAASYGVCGPPRSPGS